MGPRTCQRKLASHQPECVIAPGSWSQFPATQPKKNLQPHPTERQTPRMHVCARDFPHWHSAQTLVPQTSVPLSEHQCLWIPHLHSSPAAHPRSALQPGHATWTRNSAHTNANTRALVNDPTTELTAVPQPVSGLVGGIGRPVQRQQLRTTTLQPSYKQESNPA